MVRVGKAGVSDATEFWMVMDARARYDVDAATCYEAFTRKPTDKELKAWWGRDAVLVRSYNPDKNGVFQSSDLVGVLP